MTCCCWDFLAPAPPREEVDVVVVGAGLAGLACALHLKDAAPSLRCRVLEARQLVGGRASRGGADWVHGQHVATWRYLKRFNLQTDGSQNGWDNQVPGGPECWIYVDGQLKGPQQVFSEPNRMPLCASLFKGLFFGKFDELIEKWIEEGKEDVSMASLSAEAFDQPPSADERRLMEGMMAEWHAADLADVGVYEDDLYSDRIKSLAEERPEILTEDGDEGHWRILGGHQGLAEKMAQNLDLRLDSQVVAVNWSGAKVHVTLHSGHVITARCAVVTVPLACLEDIRWTPTLPERKQMAIRQLGRGVTTTVYFNFRERFWPEKMAFLFHSLSSQVFWPGRNRTVLTAYFGGRTANEELLCLSDEALTQEILRQMSVIFQKPLVDLQSLLVKSDVKRWDNDPFAKMAYSYCPVGTAPLRASLAATEQTLLFAGEATHPTKASFAHGALEEGERAAKEVLQMLN